MRGLTRTTTIIHLRHHHQVLWASVGRIRRGGRSTLEILDGCNGSVEVQLVLGNWEILPSCTLNWIWKHYIGSHSQSLTRVFCIGFWSYSVWPLLVFWFRSTLDWMGKFSLARWLFMGVFSIVLANFELWVCIFSLVLRPAAHDASRARGRQWVEYGVVIWIENVLFNWFWFGFVKLLDLRRSNIHFSIHFLISQPKTHSTQMKNFQCHFTD